MNFKESVIISAIGSPFVAFFIARLMRNKGFDLNDSKNQHLLCVLTALPLFVFVCIFMEISIWMRAVTVVVGLVAGELSFALSGVAKTLIKPKTKTNI